MSLAQLVNLIKSPTIVVGLGLGMTAIQNPKLLALGPLGIVLIFTAIGVGEGLRTGLRVLITKLLHNLTQEQSIKRSKAPKKPKKGQPLPFKAPSEKEMSKVATLPESVDRARPGRKPRAVPSIRGSYKLSSPRRR